MRIKNLHSVGLFVGIGFLATAICLLFVRKGDLLLTAVAGLFLLTAGICFHISIAAKRAQKTIRCRIPWENLQQEQAKIRKKYNKNVAVLLAGGGGMMLGCSSLLLLVLYQNGELFSSSILYAIPFFVCALILIGNGIRIFIQ